MKYDVDLALGHDNTSHAQVLDLVGTGKRVLDVGCSTGAIGRALKGRSNRVWGLEIDAQAARMAEQDLEQVVVGDIEAMDLLDRFDKGSFDVIVCADVLEHLKDPVSVLERLIPLLADGGSFVISLPNVAHGSVRLALLEGRFEYRPLGLLDETHLRFFTRRSVEDLVKSAGLTVIDMRRTTADIFETEIPLAQDGFDRRLVRDIRSAPDSDTYQFVFRAAPHADRMGDHLTAELVARNEELSSLRAEVTQIRALAERFVPPHSVGLFVGNGQSEINPWTSLRTSITSLEIRRRVDRVALVHLSGSGRTESCTWRGEPIEDLGSLDAAAAELVTSVYDAVILAGDENLAEASDFVADLLDRGCPVLPFGVPKQELEGLSGVVREGAARAGRNSRYEPLPGMIAVPDPLVLADRLVGGNALSPRLHYLRETGRISVPQPHLVVSVHNENPDLLPALARTVTELAAQTQCQVVVLAGPGGESSIKALVDAIPGANGLADPLEIDLLALVSEARLVVTNAGAVAAVGLALRKPVLAYGGQEELAELADWSADPDLAVATPAEMLGRIGLAEARAADAQLVRRLQAPVELAYDDIGAAVRGATSRRLAVSMTEILELFRSRIGTLEQANAALQGRLVSERNALGARAIELSRERGDREPPTPRELAELQHRLNTAEAQVAIALQARHEDHIQMLEAVQRANRLQEEVDLIMATRTMRALSPARKLYGRLRSH